MSSLSEQDWILAALRALGEGGVASVKVEVLAKELGVTKGSFYHHFGRRKDLLDGVLRTWIRVGTQRVIDQTDAATSDPTERLLQLSMQVFARTGAYDNVDAAIRDWAAMDVEVSRALAEVDAQRIAYVAALIAGAGIPEETAQVRAHVMYKALIGEFTWRRHGGPGLSTFALRDMVSLLVSPPRVLPIVPMALLPASVSRYKTTAEFTESTIPKGLLANHCTKEGCWGRIVVTFGRLRYQLDDGPCWVLECGVDGIIEPLVLHRVEPLGEVRFRVEFLRL